MTDREWQSDKSLTQCWVGIRAMRLRSFSALAVWDMTCLLGPEQGENCSARTEYMQFIWSKFVYKEFKKMSTAFCSKSWNFINFTDITCRIVLKQIWKILNRVVISIEKENITVYFAFDVTLQLRPYTVCTNLNSLHPPSAFCFFKATSTLAPDSDAIRNVS